MRLSASGDASIVDAETQERWRRDAGIAAVLGQGGHRGLGSCEPSSSGGTSGSSSGPASAASEVRSRSDRRGAPDADEDLQAEDLGHEEGDAGSPSDQWLVRGIERAMEEVSPALFAPARDRDGQPVDTGGQGAGPVVAGAIPVPDAEEDADPGQPGMRGPLVKCGPGDPVRALPSRLLWTSAGSHAAPMSPVCGHKRTVGRPF